MEIFISSQQRSLLGTVVKSVTMFGHAIYVFSVIQTNKNIVLICARIPFTHSHIPLWRTAFKFKTLLKHRVSARKSKFPTFLKVLPYIEVNMEHVNPTHIIWVTWWKTSELLLRSRLVWTKLVLHLRHSSRPYTVIPPCQPGIICVRF